MAESRLTESIRRFLTEMASDAVEERVVDHVIREVHGGRKLADALNDPYVKNRLSEEKLARVLEKPEVIEAIEQQIEAAFDTRDFGFAD